MRGPHPGETTARIVLLLALAWVAGTRPLEARAEAQAARVMPGPDLRLHPERRVIDPGVEAIHGWSLPTAPGGRDPLVVLGGTSAARADALEVRGGITVRDHLAGVDVEAGVDGVGGWELGLDDRFAGSLGCEAYLVGSLSLARELTLGLQARAPATLEPDEDGPFARTALHAGPELAWTSGAVAARLTWLPRLRSQGPDVDGAPVDPDDYEQTDLRLVVSLAI